MYLHWMLALGQGDTPMTQLSPEVIAADRRADARQPLPLRRPAARRPRRQPLVLVREPPHHQPRDRVPRRPALPRRDLHRHRPHRRRARRAGQARHPRLDHRARRARLLRVALQRLHAEEHHAAAHARRAGRRPRDRHGGGDGARPVPARHGRPQPRRLLHRAAGSHLQEGQDVVARRGHLRHRQVRVRRHRRSSTRRRADGGVTYLASATRYRPPQVVVDIATDDQPSVVRERHGVFFDGSSPLEDDPVAPYGKDFADPANLPFWWSLGALGMWPLAEVSVADGQRVPAVGDRPVRRDQPARPDQRLRPRPRSVRGSRSGRRSSTSGSSPRPTPTPTASRRCRWRRCSTTASARCATRSTPGRRPSTSGRWCSPPTPSPTPTRSPIWADDEAPGYWTGEASMPRSRPVRAHGGAHLPADVGRDHRPARVERVRVPALHPRLRAPGPLRRGAPGGQLDRRREGRAATSRCGRGGPRRGGSTTRRCVSTNGMTKPFDLVAEGGPDNVWIVEVGSDDDGSLDDFVAALTDTEPSVVRDDGGFIVSWTSPSVGIVDFSSTGPFVVDGVEQPLGDHPRHESPWGSVEHLSPPVQPDRRRLHLVDRLRRHDPGGVVTDGVRHQSLHAAVGGGRGGPPAPVRDRRPAREGRGGDGRTHGDGSLVGAYEGWRTDSVERSFDDILADDTIDLVVTAAIPTERADVALAAIAAGKHVLSDKPGVTTMAQLDAVRAAVAGRPGRPWTVLFTERFENRAIAEAVRLAQAGAVGPDRPRDRRRSAHDVGRSAAPTGSGIRRRPAASSSTSARTRSTSSWRSPAPAPSTSRSSPRRSATSPAPITRRCRTSAR